MLVFLNIKRNINHNECGSSDDLECWYRNVDESGQTDHGPTNYTPDEIVGVYEESLRRMAGKN